MNRDITPANPTYLMLSVFMLVCLSCVGCVTQEFVVDANQRPQERVINKQDAAMARLKLALQYLKSGRMALAKLNLDRAKQFDNNLDGLYSSYAYYYQYVGEMDFAEQSYIQALNDFPDNNNTRNNFGAFLCDNRRYNEAQQHFLLAIKSPVNSQMANSHENAGLCALRNEKWQRASSHLTATLAYDPKRQRAILGLIQAHIELGKFNQALTDITRYHDIYGESSPSLWLLIQIQYQRKNLTLVNRLGHKLVEQYPNSPATKAYLAKNLK